MKELLRELMLCTYWGGEGFGLEFIVVGVRTLEKMHVERRELDYGFMPIHCIKTVEETATIYKSWAFERLVLNY